MKTGKTFSLWRLLPVAAVLLGQGGAGAAAVHDLDQIKAAGVLRHIGIRYARFVEGAEGKVGFDVEIVRRFAQRLGVKYEFHETDWTTFAEQLTGNCCILGPDGKLRVIGQTNISGDIAASGITILESRQQLVDFSDPVFPTRVWLIARSDASFQPIRRTSSIDEEIASTWRIMSNQTVLCKTGTCLDPKVLELADHGVKCQLFQRSLNELAGAIISPTVEVGDAKMTVLDVPDVVVAMVGHSTQIKILGAVNKPQKMGAAFRKDCAKLRAEYNKFLAELRQNGEYDKLIDIYYPYVKRYFPEFFTKASAVK